MRPLFIAALASLALTQGCGSGARKESLYGAWTGTAGMSYAAMQKDAAGDNEQSRFLAAQEMESKTIKLELKADGTATFVNERTVDATWTLEGDTVKLVLPAQPGEEGKWFSGTYILKMQGEKEMSGPDPNVEGFTLIFRK